MGMLSRITGVLEHLEANVATVALGGGASGASAGADAATTGIAYDVLLPAFLAERMSRKVGETVTLHTVQLFEGASQGGNLTPRLIGFSSRSDRSFFLTFTTVKGVGPRKALRAMAAPPGQIALAIAEKDAAALKALPEIGQRLAATIVAELAGKVERFVVPVGGGAERVGGGATDSDATPEVRSGAAGLTEPARQAIEALVRLGAPRAEAERKVAQALERDESLGGADASADRVLTAALSESA